MGLIKKNDIPYGGGGNAADDRQRDSDHQVVIRLKEGDEDHGVWV